MYYCIMEKAVQYHSDYDFELLENVAIFRLRPILNIHVEHVLFFEKDESLVLITPKSRQRLVAKNLMEMANEKELQLYLEDLSFSHSCVRKAVKCTENNALNAWDLVPNNVLKELVISKTVNGELVI